MNALLIIAAGLFVIGYGAITFEHNLRIHKAATALLLAITLWVLATLNGQNLSSVLEAAGSETFGIIVFLLAAMTLVEVLVHYKLFDWVRVELLNRNLGDRAQFFLIAWITFLLSSVIDNLTATIIMISIARRFFRNSNLIVVAAAIVVMANAGGAWSPIGDVTTIMLWLQGKFTAWEIMSHTFFASVLSGLVTSSLLSLQLKGDTRDSSEDLPIIFHRSELGVIGLALISFSFPLAMSGLGLPPYMGLLAGLGLVWFVTSLLSRMTNHETHLTADIESMIRKVDMPSIMFFLGILLSVAALNALGVLEIASQALIGKNPSFVWLGVSDTALGYLSSLVDNVPLTALSIDLIKSTDPRIWTLLAFTVGTGGSHLIIGSAAGVVAMGMVPELDSVTYMRRATVAVGIGYLAGIAVWILQVVVLG